MVPSLKGWANKETVMFLAVHCCVLQLNSCLIAGSADTAARFEQRDGHGKHGVRIDTKTCKSKWCCVSCFMQHALHAEHTI